jgi:pyridoxine 4-dehydrogenase
MLHEGGNQRGIGEAAEVRGKIVARPSTAVCIVLRRKERNMESTSAKTEWGSRAAAKSGQFQIGGDLSINRLGFGAMRITGKGVWGEPRDRNEAIRVLRRAVDLGINFIDTADSYGPAVSEEIIAEALHPYPAGLVIATKAGFDRPGPDKWFTNGRPEHLRAACEGSLRRLRLERIDVFQLHRIDEKVPAGDQLGTLKDLQAQGKIKHIGLSEVSVAQIEHARTIVPVVSVQNRYSVVDRAADDVVDYCERENLGFIPWFPLAAGDVSAAGSALEHAAKQLKITPAQLALKWLLWRSAVILPIPGTSSVAHLEENIAAAALKVNDATLPSLGKLARSA